MKAQKLLNEILPILYSVKEDAVKLQKILTFLDEEIYSESVEFDEFLAADINEWLAVRLEKIGTESQADEKDQLDGVEDNEINPETVPVSMVCQSCKVHWIDSPEENLLCRVKRFENRHNKDFKCSAFEKI